MHSFIKVANSYSCKSLLLILICCSKFIVYNFLLEQRLKNVFIIDFELIFINSYFKYNKFGATKFRATAETIDIAMLRSLFLTKCCFKWFKIKVLREKIKKKIKFKKYKKPIHNSKKIIWSNTISKALVALSCCSIALKFFEGFKIL